MPVTMKQVRAALDPEEPQYEQAAAELGADALQHLEKLVAGTDVGIATKAASLAGMIRAPGSASVLDKAARADDPRVRVAAAGGAKNLPAQDASGILGRLVRDEDPGVQKTALKAVPKQPTADLRSAIEDVKKGASIPEIRELSNQTLQRVSK